jgi:hypothetical protein
MVVGVLSVRYGLASLGLGTPVVSLCVEAIGGAAIYVVAALIFARDAAGDLTARVVDALKSRA